MEKTDDSQLPEIPKKILNIFQLAIWGFALAAIVYFGNFHSGWGDQQTFAQFGDFIGGTLNPFLSFLTIALLIWSIRLQMHELSLTREELRKSADALKSSVGHQAKIFELQTNTEKRRELEDNLSYHYNRLDVLLNEKSFTLYFEDSPVQKSFLDLFYYQPLPPGVYIPDEDPYVTSVMEEQHLTFMDNLKLGKVATEYKGKIGKIKEEISYIIQSSCDLSTLLYNDGVKYSRYTRTRDMIKKMGEYYLLSKAEVNQHNLIVDHKFYEVPI